MGRLTAAAWTRSLALTIALFLGLVPGGAFAQIPEKPKPPRLVNDLAGLMSAGEVQALEEKLGRYHDTTSTQLAVVTVQSLNGYDVGQYGYELAEKWGIGQKGTNNGILVLISVAEKKSSIQVGYGLEARVPDAYALEVRTRIMRPALQQGQYYKAFDEATDALIKMMAGEYKATPKARQSKEEDSRFPFWLIILIVIIIFMIARRNRGGGTTIGGNRGFRGGFFPPIILGGGGFGGGGRSWGGGGGGGGFGGFGGGSFGGGGSSGDW